MESELCFLLCVLAEAVFGEHEGIRLPREDYVERLAEERRGELWCARGLLKSRGIC